MLLADSAMLPCGPDPVKQSMALPPHSAFTPETILSGGQTGVDRAALDVALAIGLPCGGWCPAGRMAEDGPIDGRYPLQETASADPAERTILNVEAGDATLIVSRGPPTGGTALALSHARALERPVLVIEDPHADSAALQVGDWLGSVRPASLNVAGPRESEAPGIYDQTTGLLRRVWSGSSVAEAGE